MYILNKILSKLRWLSYRFMHPNRVARLVGVKMGKNCSLRTKEFGSEPYLIELGNNVHTSINVAFLTHDGAVQVLRTLYNEDKNIDLFGKIVVGNNVFIGYSVIILPGTKIGNNVIIGAGSIVRGNIDSNSVYAGVPAKYICSLKKYKERNQDKFTHTKHMSAIEKKRYLLSQQNIADIR